jgi:putative OPT family oligopeptide transporter
MAERGAQSPQSPGSKPPAGAGVATPTAPVVPYVPAGRDLPELTWMAILLGLVLAVVMGAANTYLGLRVGLTVSASIPAAVISMAILRGVLRRGSILENNIVQTMASTGEALAAGVIFTVPALVMIGEWQEFEFWPTTLIALLGGVLGVAMMVPMRKALIIDRQDLVYPEGVACAEVLITGEERSGGGMRAIAVGLGVGALFKLAQTGFSAIQGTVEGAVARGRSVLYAGSDMSVALLAVGYIVNLEIASLVFLGGALGWLVAIPLLGGYGGEAALGSALDHAGNLWSTQVRFIGVGAMLVGGVHSIWSVRGGILAGVKGLGAVRGMAAGSIVRTERTLPPVALLSIFLITCLATGVFYDYLIGNVAIAAVATVVLVVVAFLFVAVATYIAGLVGSSNSPVSGMTICALLIAAGVLIALGVQGDSAVLATLGVAGVVCCAVCTSGDIAQDLKTGSLVGATPARQQWAELLAAVVSAFFFAPILTVLHRAYTIGEGLPAPQAGLFASLTEGLFRGGDVPLRMVGIGAGLGVALIIINVILAARGVKFRAHVMPVAVGIYLPFSLAPPMLLGGILRHVADRRHASGGNEARDPGVLLSSGLIAGEAILGIVLAAVIAAEVALPEWPLPFWVSLLAFAGVAWVLYRFAMRRPVAG